MKTTFLLIDFLNQKLLEAGKNVLEGKPCKFVLFLTQILG